MTNESSEGPIEGAERLPYLRETKQIRKLTLYAFLLNLGLATLQVILAFLSGSLAIAAGAIDSATDSVTSLAVYGGVRLSVKKTRTFPLGLYKIENVISVVVAFFIFIAGYEIARHIVLGGKEYPKVSLTILVLIAASTVIVFFFGRYVSRIGKQTESPTLLAEGRHRQVDLASYLVVLTAVILTYFHVRIEIRGVSVDRIAAAIILIFIAYTGWHLLSDGMRVLLDASIDPQTLEQIRKIIESEPGVVSVTSLLGRNAGRFRFIQTVVILRTDDLQKAHKISEAIENDVRRQIPHVERVVVHYEPRAPEYLRVAVPLEQSEGTISAHFGEAPHFAIISLNLATHEVEKREILKNPYSRLEKAKGMHAAEWLVKQNVDIVLTKESLKDKGPGYLLENAGVKMDILSADQLNEVIDWAREHFLQA
jgi:cation diffusion facilitator family transporter